MNKKRTTCEICGGQEHLHPEGICAVCVEAFDYNMRVDHPSQLTDGAVLELRFHKPPLKLMKTMLGGYARPLTLGHGEDASQMMVNEDGPSLGMQLNQRASLITGQPIVGPVVILKGKARWT